MDKEPHKTLDFNKEDGIPLETIHKTRTTNTSMKSLDQQFDEFEQRIQKEFFNDGTVKGFFNTFGKQICAHEYIQRMNKELATIISTEPIIEKYLQKKESYFAQSIKYLIEKNGKGHFESVSCATLETITNPHTVPSSSRIISGLPLVVRTYVLKRAFENIKEKYPLNLREDIRELDVHAQANLAATASKGENGIFELWNLTTGKAHKLPTTANLGGVKFNGTGSRLMTVTLAKKSPQTILIQVWNTHTKRLTHTIEHTKLLNYCFFKNKIENFDSDDRETLLFFDADGYLSIYELKENTDPVRTDHLNIGKVDQKMIIEDLGKYYCITEQNQLCTNNPFIWLLSQAIKKTEDQTPLATVKNTSFYQQQLTPYEQSLIDKEIEAKIIKLDTLMQLSKSLNTIFN